MYREVSCEKEADSREKLGDGATSGAVSCGLVEAWCSSEVSGPPDGLETTVETTREQPAAPAGSESAVARLAALEHLLDAVTALLDAGESARAKMLAHAWRVSRQ